MANLVMGNEYGKQLCEALGINVDESHVNRIVIDVRPDEAIKVYIEMKGSDRLLDVKLPISAVEVVQYGT